MNKNKKAQAGLEYVMTYGWVLLLIVTVATMLFFVFSPPVSTTIFSSSDPTKILLRASNVSGTNAEIQLQNVTGGKIQITGITPTNYNNCTINGSTSSISVGGGNIMKLNCAAQSDNKGSIKIDYTDYAGLQRTVIINAGGTTSGTASLCGNGSLDSGELCDGALGLSDTENMECNSTCNKIRITGCTTIIKPGDYFIDSVITPQEGGNLCIVIAYNEWFEQIDGVTLEGIGPNAYIDLLDFEGTVGIGLFIFEELEEGITIQNVKVQGSSEEQVGLYLASGTDEGAPLTLLNNDTTGIYGCGVYTDNDFPIILPLIASGNQCGTCYSQPGYCGQICTTPFEECNYLG